MSRTAFFCPPLTLALVALLGCSEAPTAAHSGPLPGPPPSGNAAADANSASNAGAAFSYSPVGRRDPFVSYLTQLSERQAAHVQDHRHEDTENFEVKQFRLTGLITGTSQPKAMVDDPNGEAHVVHIGSRMGKNGGRVHSIGAKGITVLEEYVDASGKAVTVPINVSLPEDLFQGTTLQQ